MTDREIVVTTYPGGGRMAAWTVSHPNFVRWEPGRWWRHPTAGLAILALATSLLVALAFPRPSAAVPGGAELAPGSVDQNSGAFTTSVTIAVPTFHGIEPELRLAYSSAGPNGPFGVGWQLTGTSMIERTAPRRGAPSFTTADEFHLDGQPLVASIALGGTHVAARQSFQRISFDPATNIWTVIGKDGVVNTYATRLNVVAGKTLRWMLSSVTDPHGNRVNYGYWCDGSDECYLNTVSYNDTVITLYRQVRPDPIVSAAGVAMTTMRYRIKTIDVKVSGARARAYALAYVASTLTGRSLLDSVTRYGTDAVLDVAGNITSGHALPPVTATYRVDAGAMTVSKPYTNWCVSGNSFGAADFDGDAQTDFWCHDTSSNTWVAISNGSGGFTSRLVLSNWCGAGFKFGTGDFNADGRSDFWCHDTSSNSWVAMANASGTFIGSAPLTNWCAWGFLFGVGDFNGDAKTDFYCHDTSSNSWVAASNGSGGFTGFSSFSGWCAWGFVFDTGDFNGDGRTDFLCHDTSANTWVLVSDGSGGYDGFNQLQGWCAAGHALGTGDFNGDGKSDLSCHDTSGNTWVLMSNGYSGFGHPGQLSGWCHAGRQLGAGDFNGDGQTDLWCHESAGNSWIVRSNGVGGFVPLTTFNFCAASVGVGDFNGDGKTDMWCHDANANSWVAFAGSLGRTDVVTEMSNELGGSTQVSYLPGSSWPVGVVEAGLQPSPARTLTTSQVKVGDGRGLWITTDYAYRAGRFDPKERRMLGFEGVTSTDSSGASTVTSFSVEAGYRTNRVSQVDRFSAGGALLERTATTYADTAVAGVYTSLLSARTHSLCQGIVRCQSTQVTFVDYDRYGNVGQQQEQGDLAVVGDGRTTDLVYQYNLADYLVDRVTSSTVYAGIGTTGAKLSQTTYGYSPAGDNIRTSKWLNTANIMVSTTATYDSWGNQISVTDAESNTTTTLYDSYYHRYPLRRCNALRQCVTNVHDAVLDRLVSVTDPHDKTVSWSYDVFGRQVLEARPDGSSTSTTYANWGNPNTQYVETSITDGSPAGLWQRNFIDGLGRTTKSVSKPDRTVLTVYNAQGQVWKTSNPFRTGAVPVYSTYGYDALGRTTSLTHPDGSATTTRFSIELDNTATDPDYATPRLAVTTCSEVSTCTRVGHDGYGNEKIVSEWDGVGTAGGVPEYRTHAAYDRLGNLVRIVDSVGNITTVDWDSLGRKTMMTDPDLGTWSYEYDRVGNVTRQTDGAGHVINSTFDSLNRVTTRSTATARLATFRYDEIGHGFGTGRLTSMVDATGSTSWTYDPVGRVTSQTQVIDGHAYTVGQTFDPAGRRASLTYPDRQVVRYGYDLSGCLVAVGGYLTDATCDPTVTSQTLGNGVVLTQRLDPDRLWLDSDSATHGTAVLQNETYLHRLDGRVRSKTSRDVNDQWTYEYDYLGRLTAATNTSAPAYSSDYQYDRVGRLVAASGGGTVPGRRTYPAPGVGHAHAPSTVASQPYTYDGGGNLLNDGATIYTYNSANRVVSSTIPVPVPMVITGAASTATDYGYDGRNQLVKTGNLRFVVLDGVLLYQSDGTSSSKFYYAGGQRIARQDNDGTVRYYVTNHLGSPHLLLNSAGGVAQRRIFNPNGVVLESAGAVDDPFGHAGDYLDSAGLYQRGARGQDPGLGSFTTPDPSPFLAVTAPQTLNRYAYALNDPINNVDHSGKSVIQVVPEPGVEPVNGGHLNCLCGPVINLGLEGDATVVPGPKPGETTTTLNFNMGENKRWSFDASFSATEDAQGFTDRRSLKFSVTLDLKPFADLNTSITFGKHLDGWGFDAEDRSYDVTVKAMTKVIYEKHLTVSEDPEEGSPTEHFADDVYFYDDEGNPVTYGQNSKWWGSLGARDWSGAFPDDPKFVIGSLTEDMPLPGLGYLEEYLSFPFENDDMYYAFDPFFVGYCCGSLDWSWLDTR